MCERRVQEPERSVTKEDSFECAYLGCASTALDRSLSPRGANKGRGRWALQLISAPPGLHVRLKLSLHTIECCRDSYSSHHMTQIAKHQPLHACKSRWHPRTHFDEPETYLTHVCIATGAFQNTSACVFVFHVAWTTLCPSVDLGHSWCTAHGLYQRGTCVRHYQLFLPRQIAQVRCFWWPGPSQSFFMSVSFRA